MIDPTAKDMKNRFRVIRADLIGWLNHISVYPEKAQCREDSSIAGKNPICCIFEQTMKFYCKEAQQAKETLHEVIFYTLVHREDYNTDFDVPSFENCMTFESYMDIVQHFSLYTYMKRELWRMDIICALSLIGYLFCGEHHKNSNLCKAYLQLILGVEDQEQFSNYLDVFIDKTCGSLDISQLQSLLLIVYERSETCIKMARRKTTSSLTTLNRLMEILHNFLSIYSLNRSEALKEKRLSVYNYLFATVEMVKESACESVSLTKLQDIESYYYLFEDDKGASMYTFNHYKNYHSFVQRIEPRSPPTLKEHIIRSSRDSDINEHEHVFVSIVEYICQGALPNQRDERSALSAEEDDGMERLTNIIQKQHADRPLMLKTFYNCVYIIRHRSMFWKSILKVIIQFLDLWIGVIEESRCADIFSSWISHENMLPVLYQIVLKHVQHYKIGITFATIEEINKLTGLLEQCIDHVETNEQLLIFRDYVFHNRDGNEGDNMPILGLISFWNIPFDQEMTRVVNQITSVEHDAQVPEEIIRRLIKLSVLWPYEVLRQLFMSSIRNKNQHIAIIPALYNLGNLSMLKKRNCFKNSDGIPLLLLVLKEFLTSANSAIIEDNRENIIQFIKACCTPEKFQPELPLILMPNSIVDQALLPLQSVLTECILQNLSTSCHIIVLEFSLHALNVFCESSSDDWTTLLNSSDLPAFLYCSPETYLIFLTDILALRFTHDGRSKLPLRLWESALKIVFRFFDLIKFALKTEGFPRIRHFFTDTLKNYDWQTQLIWYNVTRGINKHSLYVPSPFFRITGALDDLFVEDKNLLPMTTDTNEGWYEILTACRLSSCLNDELFEHKDQWTYNLLLLWNHPYEDKLLLECLEQVLHPKASLSVSIEYQSLLVHFLRNLYISFPEAHKVIIDYNGYENAQMLPIVRDLSHVGTRTYFIILYTTLLIQKQIKSQTEGDKQDNYFVSHLIKLLQGLTDWGSISEPTTSYSELKAIGAKLIPCHLNGSADTAVRAQSEVAEENEFRVLQYPLLSTPELISNRALSMLTLFHMCSILCQVKDDNQRQSIERFVMLIMEGIIDKPSHQIFQRMLQQQPKSRSKLWKQKKSSTKFLMEMRPVITKREEILLRPVVEKLPNSGQILQALGLTVLHKEQLKKLHLYFLN